ncbi:MAG: peptide-methionine (S)-S-oxide reductase MsrA [Prochlorococcaceae cyanobacterium]|nr:Peptide methionine sulfoxide reductase [Synechococcus sp. RCC307]|tara:strand:+ start:3087 stop:3752 length:666 start_codon:yes stop_codon:yes gene_type:complete
MKRRLLWLLASVLVGLASLLGPSSVVWAADPQQAVFAGGCFWCLEHDLEVLPGVISAESGYSGGTTANPTYQQVSSGRTGHAESVLVRFDPDRISYATLLRAFWRNVDPLDGEGQFCDRGSSYRPVIFTGSADQLEQASESERLARQELGTSGALAVAIEPLKRFWPAEDYHQDYAERQALTYNFYRWRCGRDARLDAVWGEQARLPVVWKTATAFPTNAG